MTVLIILYCITHDTDYNIYAAPWTVILYFLTLTLCIIAMSLAIAVWIND